MASTGITPGLEVETLTPAQVQFIRDFNGQPALRVVIRKAAGKRKNDRVVWARSHDVWPVLNDMRALLAWIKAQRQRGYHRNNPNGYRRPAYRMGSSPATSQMVFGKVLSNLGLRHDPVTKKLALDVCLSALLRYAEPHRTASAISLQSLPRTWETARR